MPQKCWKIVNCPQKKKKIKIMRTFYKLKHLHDLIQTLEKLANNCCLVLKSILYKNVLKESVKDCLKGMKECFYELQKL